MMNGCQSCGHDKMHWGCCWKPLLGLLLWLLSAVSLILAWVAFSRGGVAWGWDEMHWYINALAFGVLALGCKMKGCRMGSCKDCKMCKPTNMNS